MTHVFNDDLRKADELAAHPMWTDFYRAKFPGLVRQEAITDRKLQRQGGDRRLIFPYRELLVEEKYREKDYGDFLFETLSNEETGAPGWIERDLACDYLTYIVKPLRCGWLLSWPRLRAAWVKYGSEWRELYGERRAQNVGYVTVSVPVPRALVLDRVEPADVIEASGKTWIRRPA